ncbi:hypothetical protein ACFL27_24985 [candidate division CSSED10-310 bacterium]|uniref:Uncharacterized protein n=1 Tax=candidate division CSSED10-310 bacterium TaxID=2855610 RepID=A0ABV6Z4T9_UNCC1
MENELAPLILGIMVFMIPILAIVLKSQVGKAFANYLESKAKAPQSSIEGLVHTENMLLSVETRLTDIELELRKLRESNESLQKLLLDKGTPKQLS